MTSSIKPVVALTLGDPAGIGAELIARLLGQTDATQHANIVLLGDPWLWQEGQRIAGVEVSTAAVQRLSDVRARSDVSKPAFLTMDTVRSEQVTRSKAEAAGGASVLEVLNVCMDSAKAGEVDAICFAPLN